MFSIRVSGRAAGEEVWVVRMLKKGVADLSPIRWAERSSWEGSPKGRCGGQALTLSILARVGTALGLEIWHYLLIQKNVFIHFP